MESNKLHNGFQTVSIHTFEEIATYVCNHAWSHCVWNNGVRNTNAYLYSDIIALDFDHGMTIDEAVWNFGHFNHIIGTTKSHQIEKNDIVADRFRVILKLNERINNAELLRYVMRHYTRMYSADTQATDAARYFWPCINIISTNINGVDIPIDQAQRELRRSKQRIEEIQEQEGTLVTQLMRRIEEEGIIRKGNRDTLSYKLAISMLLQGYKENEIASWIAARTELDNDFTIDTIYAKIASAKRSILYQNKFNSLTN